VPKVSPTLHPPVAHSSIAPKKYTWKQAPPLGTVPVRIPRHSLRPSRSFEEQVSLIGVAKHVAAFAASNARSPASMAWTTPARAYSRQLARVLDGHAGSACPVQKV
jgi:hypothetical protein